MVFGTRPEVIKIAPVYLALKKAGIDIKLIATAQHREMMDMMLEVFGIKPDIDMNIMTKNQTPNTVASKVFENMEKALKEMGPDVLMVQGDTTTAMSSAIAAFHMGIKVAHIEAGLRSENLYDPFPEEMNRRVIGVVAEYNFAPTKKAKENLLKEGVSGNRIYITGNTVIDALKYINEKFNLESLRRGIIGQKDYVLVTLHRRENWGKKMREILLGLRDFSRETGMPIVFPVHKNPRVREVVEEVLGEFELATLLEPVDYVKFLSLLSDAKIVLTDSGGIQEEAPSFGKFVVVARNTTERPELIESGWGVLAGTERNSIKNALKEMTAKNPKNVSENPFGDGKASIRIAKIILGEDFEEFQGVKE